jgi:hypothetical protein
MHLPGSRRLTGDCAHVRSEMWVVYGRVPLLGQNLVAPSLEGLPVSRHFTAAHQDDDDHAAHRHVLIYSVG